MFLLAVYLTLRKHKRELLGDLALGGDPWSYVYDPPYHPGGDSGVCPCLAYETEGTGQKVGDHFREGFLIVAALGIAYFPWVYNGIKGGYSLKMIVGFSIASKTNPGAADPGAAGAVGAYYAGYFVLIIAPVLGL